MKWIKGNEKRPEVKDRVKLHIKYKGSPDLLIFINGVWFWFEKNIEESRNFPVHEGSWAAIEWLDESATLPSSSVTGDWKEKFIDWLCHELRGTTPSVIERIVDHVERYIVKKYTPVTGESEAIERDRNTQYTYYHVDFNNCPSFDGDYMICESIEEIKGLLELVDADLDDPLTKCSVEIKGVGMTPNEYAEWFNENI